MIDQTAVNRIADLAGWLNIKSNVVEDSSVAIDLYRLRGLIEQGFDQLKISCLAGVCVSRKPRISGNCWSTSSDATSGFRFGTT